MTFTRERIPDLPQNHLTFETVEDHKLEILVNRGGEDEFLWESVCQNLMGVLQRIFDGAPTLKMYEEYCTEFCFESYNGMMVLAISLDRTPTPPVITLRADDADGGHMMMDILYRRESFGMLIRELLPFIDPSNSVIIDSDGEDVPQDQKLVFRETAESDDLSSNNSETDEIPEQSMSENELSNQVEDSLYKSTDENDEKPNDEKPNLCIDVTDDVGFECDDTKENGLTEETNGNGSNNESEQFDSFSSDILNTILPNGHDIISSPSDLDNFDPMGEAWYDDENKINKKKIDLTMPADVSSVAHKQSPLLKNVKFVIYGIPKDTQRIQLKSFFKNCCLGSCPEVTLDRVNIDEITHKAYVEVIGSGGADEFFRCVNKRQFCSHTLRVCIQYERMDPETQKLHSLVQQSEKERLRAGKGGWYAVAAGRQVGIYQTWDACSEQVNGFSGAKYKKFSTKDQAEEYIRANDKTCKNRTELSNNKENEYGSALLKSDEGFSPTRPDGDVSSLQVDGNLLSMESLEHEEEKGRNEVLEAMKELEEQPTLDRVEHDIAMPSQHSYSDWAHELKEGESVTVKPKIGNVTHMIVVHSNVFDCILHRKINNRILLDGELQLLGVGGFGYAYRYTQSNLPGVSLVIKLNKVGKTKCSTPGWYREVRHTQRLSHENVIKYYGRPILYENMYYCIMEDGGDTLSEQYFNTKSMDFKDMKNAMLQISLAIDYLHSIQYDKHFVIHRDIRTDNVTVSSSGVYKLIDFGLSSEKAELNSRFESDTHWGNHLWKSPEFCKYIMFHDKDEPQPPLPPGRKSDIWMFGVLVLELLAFPNRPSFFKEYINNQFYFVHRLSNHTIDMGTYINQYTEKCPFPSAMISKILQRCLEFEEENRCDSKELSELCSQLELVEHSTLLQIRK